MSGRGLTFWRVVKPGDIIIATKLPRIARSVVQGSQLIHQLLEQRIAIHILNIGMMEISKSTLKCARKAAQEKANE